MGLTGFDYAVIRYAEGLGVSSERVYAWVDRLGRHAYRERLSERELLVLLGRVRAAGAVAVASSAG